MSFSEPVFRHCYRTKQQLSARLHLGYPPTIFQCSRVVYMIATIFTMDRRRNESYVGVLTKVVTGQKLASSRHNRVKLGREGGGDRRF